MDGETNVRPASESLKAVTRSEARRNLTTYPKAPVARAASVIRVVVDRQEHDLRPRAGPLQGYRRFDAVHDRHRDVEHQEVGREPGNRLDGRLSIANGLDHVEVRCEEPPFHCEELLVVVGQHDTGPMQGALPSGPGSEDGSIPLPVVLNCERQGVRLGSRLRPRYGGEQLAEMTGSTGNIDSCEAGRPRSLGADRRWGRGGAVGHAVRLHHVHPRATVRKMLADLQKMTT